MNASESFVMFGGGTNRKSRSVFDFIILLAKFFIKYKCKVEKKILCIYKLVHQISNCIVKANFEVVGKAYVGPIPLSTCLMANCQSGTATRKYFTHKTEIN